MFETPIPPFALDSRKEDTPEPPRTTWKRHTNHLKNCHRLTLKSSLPRDKPAWRALDYTFLACMFFFISDHVMVTQRTASIKYRPMPGAHALPPMHVEASAYVIIIYENQEANSLENITWSEFGKLKRSIRGQGRKLSVQEREERSWEELLLWLCYISLARTLGSPRRSRAMRFSPSLLRSIACHA